MLTHAVITSRLDLLECTLHEAPFENDSESSVGSKYGAIVRSLVWGS